MNADDAYDHELDPLCLGCIGEHPGKGHYRCAEGAPCQDCLDDGLTAAENIANGYDAHGYDLVGD